MDNYENMIGKRENMGEKNLSRFEIIDFIKLYFGLNTYGIRYTIKQW